MAQENNAAKIAAKNAQIKELQKDIENLKSGPTQEEVLVEKVVSEF